jgi:hypothetical protein
MSFVLFMLLAVGALSFALGLSSGRPWTAGALLAAFSLLWLLVRSPIGPIGPAMAALCIGGALAGALAAHLVRAIRAELG